MTFRAFMAENGYNVQTTFWEDFSAADIFGLSAIQDTFNRAFEEWKGNCKYLTELVVVFQKVCLCRSLQILQICKYSDSWVQNNTPRRVVLLFVL